MCLIGFFSLSCDRFPAEMAIAHDLPPWRKVAEFVNRFVEAGDGDFPKLTLDFLAEGSPVGLGPVTATGSQETFSLECALEYGELPKEIQYEVPV